MASENKNQVYLNGSTDQKIVCLTFNDGPDDVITPQILDILKDYNVKGSFFFKGSRVNKYSEVVKRTDGEGHLVLSHAYSHQELNQMTPYDIDKEVWATEEKIENIIGKKPALIRPPFGAINQDVITETSNNDYKIVLWSIDTLDWTHHRPDDIVQNVLDNVRPGDIILMHSDEDQEVALESLPLIIQGLHDRGFRIVDLSEMLGVKAYK